MPNPLDDSPEVMESRVVTKRKNADRLELAEQEEFVL